ncbi:hypothetical protein [Polaribacter aestuariivivens]|uniref:hypothetical protein n=1 Tax=Polaribacter aestuariivivens TaxID=2304626 RepID=UPI003F49B183
MKYTDFFIEQFNHHHKAPTLSQAQIHKMLQIIDFENQLTIFELQKDTGSAYKYRKKIKDLTKNQRPQFLLEQMANQSKTPEADN